jgi:2-keto-4-pentenoate hydratase/2-oxohepta-3-ene-1,7-dioic acid hydratase in catechol pathway
MKEDAMRLLRVGPPGQERPALLDEQDQLRDLSAHCADIAGDTLLPASLARLAALDPATLPLLATAQRVGPCVGGVRKIVGVGLNYADHAAEAGMAVPTEPILFMKPTSALCGPDDAVQIPRGSTHTDWEVELCIVIGEGGRCIPEDRALAHVAGYCVANDVSERQWQLQRGGTWDKGKGHDTFAPIGPWLVTADAVPDPQALDLWLDVDGTPRQRGNTRTMVFGVRHLVSYISHFMRLECGDLVFTGTPPGVGMGHKPPLYLRPGQLLTLGIGGLGLQQQRTVAAD